MDMSLWYCPQCNRPSQNWRTCPGCGTPAVYGKFVLFPIEHADELARLRQDLAGETQRTALFAKCLHRALKLFQDAHPECNYWPSGEDNFAWLFEQVNKLDELMECGHQVRYQVTAADGGAWCAMCEVSANKEIKEHFKALATELLEVHERDGVCAVWFDDGVPVYEVTDDHRRDRAILMFEKVYGKS